MTDTEMLDILLTAVRDFLPCWDHDVECGVDEGGECDCPLAILAVAIEKLG